MSVQRISKDDTVMAVSGIDAGKSGKVLQIVGGRALVEGLNLRKKTLRKTQDNPQGGIVDKECTIAISNLMPYCPDCKKGVRIVRDRASGKSIRKCQICGHAFDS
ncbi:MAG: 50S ribosomal protein L24 [Kiritimatiellae bacterium]|nr:50S ribosomal protein L24 [Kiritimatiellia bacterium]